MNTYLHSIILVILSSILFGCQESEPAQPLNQDVQYSRLRQVDIDNTDSFSKVISLFPKGGRVDATMLTDQCGSEITGYFLVLENELSFEPLPNNQGYFMNMNEQVLDINDEVINGSAITCIDGKPAVNVSYNPGLDRYRIPNHPSNAYSFPYGSITIGSTVFVLFNQPTPITLVSFMANHSEEGIRIDFRTAFEYNSAYIEIQRSYDAKSFETITKIKSENKVNGSTYSYIIK